MQTGGSKNNLQIKQQSPMGSFYVQDLTKVLVGKILKLNKMKN